MWKHRFTARSLALTSLLWLSTFGVFLKCTIPVRANGARSQQPSSQSITWYVRNDGGDRKQCTGKVDAGYRGHGSMQPCAFKHPQYLFTNDEYGDKRWIVSGGDTILLRGGPYRMGYRGPNTKDFWGLCPGDPYGCSMPPMPSGSGEHPTRLLGENYASCDKKTQLFGGYGLASVINLGGSRNVDVQCIELTDHGQCTRVGGGYPAAEGCSSSPPLSDYAGSGITTDKKSADISLKNLDIHGFTSRGIIGAIGGNVIVDHVRIAFNGDAGWDFDDGAGTPSAPGASVRATYLTVEWNGCNEEYPITHSIPVFSCFDQDHGGYGDGIGTPDTQLDFSCDHCTFRYNTQDGFDLLHTSGSLISIRNSTAYGNMGQQWKLGPMRKVLFQNNVTVHNCSRMSAPMSGAPENYHRYLSLFCRAAGDGIAMAVMDGGSYVLQNNSFAGYGTTSYDILCAPKAPCTKSNIVYQNNLNIGYKNPADGRPPAIFYTQELAKNPFAARDHNIYYEMRSCPSGNNERCVDPRIAALTPWHGESSLDTIDFHLLSNSPARGMGAPIKDLAGDFDGADRPNGYPLDIGAFQFHAR